MFIVIEIFDRWYPTIVVDMETGIPLIFNNREEAEAEAAECRVGIVVEY